MGWETRRNGRRYYYSKERSPDGRVRSTYLGRASDSDISNICDCLAECVEGRRLERMIRRRRHRRTFGPVDAALRAVLESERTVRTVRDAYLVACGYRQHRGQWRRRRGLDLDPFPPPVPPREGAPPMATTTKRPGKAHVDGAEVLPTDDDMSPDDLERVRATFDALQACNKEDPEQADVDRLRSLLRDGPVNGGVWRVTDDLHTDHVARFAAGSENYARRELARAEIEQWARLHKEDGDSRLVWEALKHAARCRFVMAGVQRGYTHNVGSGSYTLDSGDHWERRMNAAETRYLRAVATVAKLREVEGKERRRAERHGLQMDTARRALPARGHRSEGRPDRAVLPAHAGDSVPPPEGVELSTT